MGWMEEEKLQVLLEAPFRHIYERFEHNLQKIWAPPNGVVTVDAAHHEIFVGFTAANLGLMQLYYSFSPVADGTQTNVNLRVIFCMTEDNRSYIRAKSVHERHRSKS